MSLKTVSQVQTAVGEYGNLKSEVTRNGDVISISISGKVPLVDVAGVQMGGTYLPKYHFTSTDEMQNLVNALTDAIAFLKGGK